MSILHTLAENLLDPTPRKLKRAARDVCKGSPWWRTLDCERIRPRDFQKTRENHAKKFTVPVWNIRRQYHNAQVAGLIDGPRRRFLDIGSGPGWFCWMMRRLGHEAEGLEPVSTISQQESIRMSALLGVTPIDHAVMAYEPLPSPLDGRRYDVVTTWLPWFDRDYRSKTPWGRSEWSYFLTDLATNQLTVNGLVVIQENTGCTFGGETSAWLRRLGVAVEKRWMDSREKKALYLVAGLEKCRSSKERRRGIVFTSTGITA